MMEKATDILVQAILWVTDKITALFGIDVVYANPEWFSLLPLAIIFSLIFFALFFWNAVYRRPKKTRGSTFVLLGKSFAFAALSLVFPLLIVSLAWPISETSVRFDSDPIEVDLVVNNSLRMNGKDIMSGGTLITRMEAARRLSQSLVVDNVLKEGDRVSIVSYGFVPRMNPVPTEDHRRFLIDSERLSFPETRIDRDEFFWGTNLGLAKKFTYETLARWDSFLKGEVDAEYLREEEFLRDIAKKETGNRPRIIIWISTGEDEEDRIDEFRSAVQGFAEDGVRIYSIGLGSDEGVSWLSLLDDYEPEVDYPTSYVRGWEGGVTRLKREQLSYVADVTGGEAVFVNELDREVFSVIHGWVNDNRTRSPVVAEDNEEDSAIFMYQLFLAMIMIYLIIILSPSFLKL